MKDEIVRGGIRKDIHFCAGGSGKDTCQVINWALSLCSRLNQTSRVTRAVHLSVEFIPLARRNARSSARGSICKVWLKLLGWTSDLTVTIKGITSFGRGCGRVGVPGVYTNINDPNVLTWIHMALNVAHTGNWSPFLDWINEKSEANTWRIIPGWFC